MHTHTALAYTLIATQIKNLLFYKATLRSKLDNNVRSLSFVVDGPGCVARCFLQCLRSLSAAKAPHCSSPLCCTTL